MITVNKFLEKAEYFQNIFEKNTIYIHHTAGGHRPDYVIDGWDNDDTIDEATKKKKEREVATAFVIGGISTTDGDSKFDGVIYKAFPENMWAHHLGTSFANNKTLNKISVGVEICNYGPLRYNAKTNQYFNYVNKPVPADQVVKLDKPFRGYTHYHAYTDKQLNATKELITYLCKIFPKIQLATPLLSVEGFELNSNAKNGVPGIYSHSNVRLDKFDMSPQPKLIKMMKDLTTNR